MTIYRSHVPDIDLGPPVGLFTYTFRNAREHDPNMPAFIDAVCGEKYSRKEFYNLCLRFAYGVKQWGEKRGQVAMVFRHVQRHSQLDVYLTSLPLHAVFVYLSLAQ